TTFSLVPDYTGTERRNSSHPMRSATIAAALFIPFALAAQTVPPADGVAYFEQNIRPLLAANCYACHSAKLDKPMGGLLLDSRAGMMRGGKSGVAVTVAGKPEESLLFAAVLGAGLGTQDLRMPPGKNLEPYEIEHLA